MIVSVHCYGVWDPENRPNEEMAGLETYLSSVVDWLNNNYGKVAEVIVHGAMVNDAGETEADTFGDELDRRLKERRFIVPMVYDRNSASTISSVKFAFEFDREKHYGMKDLVIVCDRARRQKTKYLARYWRKKTASGFCTTKYRVIDFDRPDPNARSNRFVQLIEILAMTVLGVERVRRKIEWLPERQKPV